LGSELEVYCKGEELKSTPTSLILRGEKTSRNELDDGNAEFLLASKEKIAQKGEILHRVSSKTQDAEILGTDYREEEKKT